MAQLRWQKPADGSDSDGNSSDSLAKDTSIINGSRPIFVSDLDRPFIVILDLDRPFCHP